MTYDKRGKRCLDFEEGLKRMTSEPLEDFPLSGDRSLQWLFEYVRDHGGTFDSRHTKWLLEQGIEKDSMASVVHDVLGSALEISLVFDQVDGSNLACLEIIGRLYQTIEETCGPLVIEGLHHYLGKDQGAGFRRGIALAPQLARHAVDMQSKETAILKERRKAREEKQSAKEHGAKGGGKKPAQARP